MYFFDPNDFNCNEIPTAEKWAEYCVTLRTLYTNYKNCFTDWYQSQDKDSLGEPCKTKITGQYSSWGSLTYSFNVTLNNLITEIQSLSSGTTCGFDKQVYINYDIAYNNMIEKSDEISLMFTTGCKLVGFNRYVGVDTTDITGDNKMQRCSGTYIKQINNGSEFIGSINVTGGNDIANKSGNGLIIISENRT